MTSTAFLSPPSDVFDQQREWMRAHGRVPRKLTIIVDLPEVPMGNEAGACVTEHMDFAAAAADRGHIGEAVRSLTFVSVEN